MARELTSGEWILVRAFWAYQANDITEEALIVLLDNAMEIDDEVIKKSANILRALV